MPSDCGTLIWGGAPYLERRCGSQGAGRIEGSASSVAGRPRACGRLPARSRPACRQRRTGVRALVSAGPLLQTTIPDRGPGAPVPRRRHRYRLRTRRCVRAFQVGIARGAGTERPPPRARPARRDRRLPGAGHSGPGAQRLACNLPEKLIPGGGGPSGLGRVPVGRASARLERRTRPTNVTLRCVYDMCTTHGTAIRSSRPGGGRTTREKQGEFRINRGARASERESVPRTTGKRQIERTWGGQ